MELLNLLVLEIMNVWFSLVDEFKKKYISSFISNWIQLFFTGLLNCCIPVCMKFERGWSVKNIPWAVNLKRLLLLHIYAFRYWFCINIC